jgi:hypothetical protein
MYGYLGMYITYHAITAEDLDGLVSSEPAYKSQPKRTIQQHITLHNSLALPTLLRSVRRNHIHQIRAQAIIALQALLLERSPHVAHLLRLEALLNNTAHESCELRLLPLVLLRPQLAVDKV